MRTTLVVIHAGAGIIGLAAGAAALVPPAGHDRWLRVRDLYAVCVGLLLAALLVLVVVDWADLDTGSRIAFTALGGLGVAMAVRLTLARRLAQARPAGWAERYLGHVYFTYISLWVGFVVLPALELPTPQLAVPLSALVVLVIGHFALRRFRRRRLGEPT